MTKARFALSFTAGGLLYNESLVVAETLLKHGGNWGDTHAEVASQNLLQCRTENTAKRKLHEISQRLKCLTQDQLELLDSGTRSEQKLILWLACCKKYQILAELARDLVRAKYLQLDYSIDAGDVAAFIETQALWHPELEDVSPSTLKKLQSVMLRMLREAELLTEAGIIVSPLVSDRFIQVLKTDSTNVFLYLPLSLGNGKSS